MSGGTGGSRGVGAAGSRSHASLLEREHEVSVLSGAVRQAAAGRSGLLLVDGPVGVGKSALMRRLGEEGRYVGLRVLAVRCDPEERASAFGVVRRLLRPLSADSAVPEYEPCSDGDVSYGVLQELHRYVSRLGARQPLLLLVDDAQHADTASLRWLAYTARRLADAPVLLAVARRTGTGARSPLLDEVAAQPRCHVLRPRPLSADGVARVVRQASGGLDEEFERACLAVTQGNPLLLSGLLRALRGDGRPIGAGCLADAGGGSSLVRFCAPVLRVLRDEGADAFAAVRAMAVLDDGAPAEMCARLAGLDTDGFVRAVRTVAAVGLVTATPDGRDWAFGHRLVREAVLADMPSGERVRSHRTAARLLLDGGACAERVADHLRAASEPVTEVWAVTVLREAARRATSQGELPRAVELLRLCLPPGAEGAATSVARDARDRDKPDSPDTRDADKSLSPDTRDADKSVSPEARGTASSEPQHTRGAATSGSPSLQSAANPEPHADPHSAHPEPTHPRPDPELLVELGLVEARVCPDVGVRRLGGALRGLSDPGRRLAVVTALAGALIRTERAPDAVRLLEEHAAGLGGADGEGGRLLEAQRLLLSAWDRRSYRASMDETALDLGLPGRTPGERALLAGRAVVRVARADGVAEALEAARRVVERGSAASDSSVFLTTAATALMYADRPDEADPVYRRLVETASGTQAEPSFVSLLSLRADAARRLGAPAEALAATGAALASAPRAPQEQTSLIFALPSAVRVHALLDRGDLAGAAELAERRFEAAAVDAWSWNEFLCARGRLRLVQGRAEEALADLLECGARQREWGRTSPAVSPWWFWAGSAHLAVGEAERARELAESAVSTARDADLPGALGTGLGLLAAVRGGRDALPLLKEAEAVLTGTPMALELIRVQVARGKVLYSLGHVDAARKVLRPALDKAYVLEARPLHREARQALLATGARPRRPVSSGPASLTPSEMQVARHAGEGLSNPEIAAALFVTQRTVEVHLTSVYRKLGLSGRRELRAALARTASA
ncbi:AAA family ATPase [Streptomyces sp. NPDC046939]|uniref:AAA family ATPase n=1 Tax=Streptomyces sp. NPDC046939 TaxID=3155376 RepID=UPI0033D10267